MPSELGDFLKGRRAALRPEDVGLAAYGERRRVPGLRREELCMLAGVSVTHYTRLEQGRTNSASPDLLNAIARALRLNEDESAHLRNLASPPPAVRPAPSRPEQASPSARQLISAMADVPALVLDRRNDVLAWNSLGHALLAGHLEFGCVKVSAQRPNLTRLLFLDEHFQDLYVNWAEEATLAVASLRLIAGRHPDDRRLAELVGQLTMQSHAFAERWNRHPVRTCTSGAKRMHHPSVGRMELAFETLQIPGSPGQRIIAYSAEPASGSEAALRLLASTVADAAQDGRTRDGSRNPEAARRR
ncbi:helix-turn-helix domain-containing protein [Streptomonospora salina]|uniref:Transcriptional regulator with XRE-family HTH domain n=1 Tax=Streptomonospora salina TaxID=104205 RepID=A0A841EB71_9ACTN|nr:helix-turn-helix transcriptional regulator [Streptomonospora salina]MBB5998579.1 transcriptional regulator with XRE-family HTH domain [Streptomonospora salina]